jgi:hypothetical protein
MKALIIIFFPTSDQNLKSFKKLKIADKIFLLDKHKQWLSVQVHHIINFYVYSNVWDKKGTSWALTAWTKTIPLP